MIQTWQVTLFGGLSARRGEQVITRFKYQKVGGLFAYLAYYPRQMHSRETLVEMFWPESNLETGRNNLSAALSSLRHQFEPPGVPSGTVLRADRYSVGLNPQMITTDVAEFDTTVRRTQTVTSTLERGQLLEQAIGIYHGPLLPGYYDEWILPEQTRLKGLYSDTVHSLLAYLEQQGDHSTGLRYARQALSLDPLDEQLHQHLMRLMLAAGQPGAALHQYRELERLLEEQGEEPSTPLRALARQIERQSGLVAPLLRSPATSIPLHEATVPSGSNPHPITVTLLLTDIESSTRHWERTGDLYRTVLETHHATLRRQFAAHHGQEIKEAGDGFIVAFGSARMAVECAIACQIALAEQRWPDNAPPLKVRMTIHTGDVTYIDGDYRGLALHRASRMLTAGHGGQILVSEATGALVRRDLSEGVHLLDLGVYRLRDVPTAERLYQVEYPDMTQATFSPLLAESGNLPNLPAQITRFFGREQEIARLVERLHPGEARLLTLSGPGGTGKTRLSLAVAERLSEAYQSAVWFVSLADLSDPGRIVDAIQDTLRIPRTTERQPLEQIIAFLSRQSSLLILDNYEHLVEGGVQIVQTLLSRVSSLTILVTSRQLLGLAGEQEFAVPPLPTPNGGEPPEQLSLFDSVALFVDRAQTAMPQFQVTSHNAPAVAALCQRLEGIPLAIELAAARTQVITPAQMLVQLEQRFGFLVSRRRDISERHRTLHAAIEWSYRLLSPELQRFFGRLSVFRGGWTTEAAETVCEEPLALDYLAQLRECSLVLTDETGETIRFRMLETIRQYADERLSAEERVSMRRYHRAHFLRLAENAQSKLDSLEEAHWLNILETDHDNLRQALTFCLEEPGDGEIGLRLGAAVQPLWWIRGYLSEGRERSISLLANLQVAEHTKFRADVLFGAGVLAECQGDNVAAHVYHLESLEIRQNLGDRAGIAKSLLHIGQTILMQGDLVTAKSLFEESRALYQESEYRMGVASCQKKLGMVATVQGDYATACSLYEESLAIQRELEDKEGMAGTLNDLGIIAHARGDHAAARTLLEQSLSIWRELGHKPNLVNTLNSLGNVTYDQGDYATSRMLHEESLAIRRALGNQKYIAFSLSWLGKAVEGQGDLESARVLYEESLILYRELGDMGGIAHALRAFASLAIKQHRPKTAARLWGASESLCRITKSPFGSDSLPVYERNVAAARDVLGEEAFSNAWAEGEAMNGEEAITSALADA